MLSNHILQKTASTIVKLTGEDLAIYSPDGAPLMAFSDNDEDHGDHVREFSRSAAESQTAFGLQFLKVFDDGRVDYIVVSKDTESSMTACKILAFQLGELSAAYRDRLDKDNFIKNLLLDNLLLVDIYSRAKKLHIEMEQSRVVMLIRLPSNHDPDELSRVKGIINIKTGDFITAVDEDSVVLVISLEEGQTDKDIEKKAQVLLDSFPDNLRERIRISYGNIVKELKEVSRSFKEAIMAMEVGEIFFKEKRVMAYSLLGIGRLVYQLPIPLCKMFIKEIFKDKRPDDFDDEMLATINKFFENSLNVSETSRQLYIHRNTLVYRLDKLEKATGLDLRIFEDAITFKIAMMVVEYMKYMEAEE